MNIKEITQLESGTTVRELQPTVKQAYMPKSGTSKKGKPWKVQSAVLVDDTGEIKASFWNRKVDLRDFIDNEITIVSPDDDVIVEDKEYSGSVHREITVGEGAKVDEVIHESLPDQKGSGVTVVTKVPFSGQDVTRASIERQVALKSAVEYSAHASEATFDDVLMFAEKFYGFLSGNNKVI